MKKQTNLKTSKILFYALISIIPINSQASFSSAELPSLSEKKINYLHYEKKINLKRFNKNPMEQYKLWRNQMIADKVPYPQAAVLSTIKQDGMPASRTIGIKQAIDKGFIFSTNPDSDKAKEINHNPRGALLIIWHNEAKKMSYQVRIEGMIRPYKEKENLKHYTFQNKQKLIKVKWQKYILEPTFVQFSHLTILKETGIVEYVDYYFLHNEWVKKIREKYFAPHGC